MTTTISQQTLTASKIMRLNYITLVLAIISVASALNNRAISSSMATVSLLDSNTVKPSRSQRSGMYGGRARMLPSPSLSSRRRQQWTSIRTRLQFSDNDSFKTAIESSWWRKLFMTSSSSANRSSEIMNISPDISSSSDNEEQENVDAYLEFLDRRYRRLHCDDREEKSQVKQGDSSSSNKGKPFSAMDWLTNGGKGNADVVTSTREQQEDALYVLGVAGLASQKLLQKHHRTTTTNSSRQSRDQASSPAMEKVVELKEQIDDAIEVNDTKSLKTEINHFIVKRFVLPIVRVIYFAQMQKRMIFKMVQKPVTSLATKAADGLVKTLLQGPKSVLNAMLSICGGRQNILRTIAVGYATMVVFRPLLHAIFAEGLAFDPLIQ